LFPSLCAPTGELTVPGVMVDDGCGERTAMMPTRRRTRAQIGHTASPPDPDKSRAREARHNGGSLGAMTKPAVVTKLVLR
jgi:hypothetical protein